jgi:hypothetical protein
LSQQCSNTTTRRHSKTASHPPLLSSPPYTALIRAIQNHTKTMKGFILGSKLRATRDDRGSPPKKRGKDAPLHERHVVPMSFFLDAVNQPESFLSQNEVGRPFGVNEEAYLRPCYNELLVEIEAELNLWTTKSAPSRLVEVRGSSGIGKSAFLAYIIATARINAEMKSFAIFHSAKHQGDISDVKCFIWIDNVLVLDGKKYSDQRHKILSTCT